VISLQGGAHTALEVEAEPGRLRDRLAEKDVVDGHPDQDDHETQNDEAVTLTGHVC
jgi:hypothetical protein